MSNTDERRVRKALQGMQFPSDKQNILAYVDERGAGADTEQAVRALPDDSYGNVDEVVNAVPQRPESADAE